MSRIVTISYGVVLVLFVVFSYFFVDANLPYLHMIFTGRNFSQAHIVSVIYFLFIAAFYAYYLTILLSYIRNKINARSIFSIILLTVCILFFSYPAMLSFDIFNYIATAKVLFFYHENPYVIMPNAFLHDPFLSFMHASNKTALYGPIWILLTGFPFLLSFNFLLMLSGFKLLVIACYCGTLFLLYKLSNNKLFPLLLFGLNPLVLIETVVSGHNDIVMVFFALLTFYFLKQKKFIWAGIFLLFSVGIKFATIFLLPIVFYIIYLHVKKQSINWEKLYYISGIVMLIVFFLSIFREEIYPWYAIWFLAFFALSQKTQIIQLIAIFSFCLLLRYLPYMYLGTHFGITPSLKIVITFGIPLVIMTVVYIKKKIYS